MAIVLFSPTADVALSPATVTQLTQLTERQFPHAGVPEIVNCRSASYVTLGVQKTSLQWLSSFFSQLRVLANFRIQTRHFAAWLQGNAQVTISGTPA